MSLSSPQECDASKRAALRDFAAVRAASVNAVAAASAARALMSRADDIRGTVAPDVASCQQFLEELANVFAQTLAAMSSAPWMTFVHGSGGLKPLKKLLGKLVFMPVKLAQDVARANALGGDALELAAVCTQRKYIAFLASLAGFIVKTDFNMRGVARRLDPAADVGPVPTWAADAYATMNRAVEERARRSENVAGSGPTPTGTSSRTRVTGSGSGSASASGTASGSGSGSGSGTCVAGTGSGSGSGSAAASAAVAEAIRLAVVDRLERLVGRAGGSGTGTGGTGTTTTMEVVVVEEEEDDNTNNGTASVRNT